MNKKIIPSGPDFIREALIVVGGALLAAVIVRMAPQSFRDFLNFQGKDQ